jgi:hypothetical protein
LPKRWKAASRGYGLLPKAGATPHHDDDVNVLNMKGKCSNRQLHPQRDVVMPAVHHGYNLEQT